MGDLNTNELATEAKAKDAQIADLNKRLEDARWFLDYCRTIYPGGSEGTKEAADDVMFLERRIQEVLNG
jgi:hypothetical protein